MNILAYILNLEDEHGIHYHKCEDCQSIWCHPEPPRGVDRNHHHDCPKCGKHETLKMYVDDVPRDPETNQLVVDYPWNGIWKAAATGLVAIAIDVRSCLTACWRYYE